MMKGTLIMSEKMSTHTYCPKHKRRASASALIMILALVCFFCAGIIEGPAHAASANGRYSLKGAKYQLYTNKACSAKAKDADGKNAVLTTNVKGDSNTLRMEPGTYYAKEVTASKGYKLDSKVYTVKITESDTSSDPATFTSTEEPLYGTPEFRLYKTTDEEGYDYEDLLGAEFTVKYYDVSAKADIAGAKPRDQWTFAVTQKEVSGGEGDQEERCAGFDWQTDTPVSYSHQGSGTFYMAGGKRVLPLGWFTIEETKAPAGFRLSDKICYGRVIEDSGSGEAIVRIEGADAFGSHVRELTIKNELSTTSIKKADADTGEAVSGATLQLLKDGTVIDEWVTDEEAHIIKGLDAGTYTLRELSAPYGYDIAEDMTFTIKEGQDTSVEMVNVPLTIKTTATDAATGKHLGSVRKDETIIDSVHLTGLYEGREYRVSGMLMDKSTGKSIKNADGSDVTASTDFTATAETMDIEVEFTVDSSSFRAGSKTVVFETLYRKSQVHDETVPAEIQEHSDIDDEAQTIIYPGITTTAADKSTGTQNMLTGEETVIEDTVKYKGLITGEEYTIEGELYDKATGSLTGIKSEATFTAEAENGTEKLDFSFDSGGMEGHALVVFETLRSGDVTLVEHDDPANHDQTVYAPKIKTTAKAQEGNREIKDVIAYENLLQGQAYVFRGWLVDTATGAKVPGSDGSVSLTPEEETSGKIEMILNAEKYENMQGHSLTAFEELYMIISKDGKDTERLVAEHKDTGDKKQTAGIYQDLVIKKKVRGGGDRKRTFSFTISFTHLVPDTAYEIEGDDAKTFMSDPSGKATVPLGLASGGQVTVKQLPKGAQYRITEKASDHVASFSISSEDMENKGAKIAKATGSNSADTSRDLTTAHETVDLLDGTVVVKWENSRHIISPETGDISGLATYSVLAFAAVASLAVFTAGRMINKRKEIRNEKH